MLTETRTWPRLALLAALGSWRCRSCSSPGAPRPAAGRAPVGPGPRQFVKGVGVGFAHSEAGAEAAAAHYLLELERAIDTLDASAHGGGGAARCHGGGGARVRESCGGGDRGRAVRWACRSGGWRSRPIRSSYSPAGAQITVLESWIYATATREALWAIERVSLIWRHGDWRVSGIGGAAPSANESLADLRSQLEFPGVGDASVR